MIVQMRMQFLQGDLPAQNTIFGQKYGSRTSGGYFPENGVSPFELHKENRAKTDVKRNAAEETNSRRR
jgi:hypothetical protein